MIRVIRSAALVLAVILLLLPATVYCLVYFLANSSFGRAEALARVSTALPNARISLGGMGVDARPFGLHLHDFDLRTTDESPILRAGLVEVRMDVRNLIDGERALDRVLLSDFDLDLTWDADGNLTQAAAFRTTDETGAADASPGGGDGGRGDLRDVVLAEGGFHLAGPAWELELGGATCAGRARVRPAATEANITCEVAGGKLLLRPPILPEPLEIGFGRLRIGSLEWSQRPGGTRVMIDGLEFEIDGRELAGSLLFTQKVGEMIPRGTLSLAGDLPPSLTRLVTAGRVSPHAGKSGELHFGLELRLTKETLELDLKDLRVDGRLDLPSGAVTGLAAEELKLSATMADRLSVGLTNLRFDSFAGDDLRAVGGRLSGGLTVQLAEGELGVLIALAAEPDPKLEPPPATSMHLRVDGAELRRLHAGETALEDLVLGETLVTAEAHQGALDLEYLFDERLSVSAGIGGATVGRVVAGATSLEKVTVGPVELAWQGVKSRFVLSRLAAAGARHGDERLGETVVVVRASTDQNEDGLLRLLLEELDVRTAATGHLTARGHWVLDLHENPLRLEATVKGLPGPRLAAFLPAALIDRETVVELLAGPIEGRFVAEGLVLFEGDFDEVRTVLSRPRLSESSLRVRRENDFVDVSVSEQPLSRQPESAWEIDKRHKRLRFGETTLAYQITTPKRAR